MSVLAGIRVIELANERISFAGKLLADMGADVILIEPPGGDPSRNYPPFLHDTPGPNRSLYFWHYNTSKRGITLDLDDATDQSRFARLADFSSGRHALRLIASRTSAYDFFIGCQNAGLGVGMVNSPEEAFEDVHFKTRGLQVPVHHEDLDITVTYPGAPFSLPRSPWGISRRAPHMGEHNDEVLGSE